jgi:hypothetical protein
MDASSLEEEKKHSHFNILTWSHLFNLQNLNIHGRFFDISLSNRHVHYPR